MTGVYPIVDTGLAASRGVAADTIAQWLLSSGARILQFRHKGHWTREVYAEAERISELCRNHGALFVVNDRADFALLLDAALHVGQEDLQPELARKVIGTGRVLGLSTHNEDQLREAAREPVDYVALGPIFATGNKENPDPVVGVERLRQWRGMVERPLVAIGGITRANARSVLDAGADAVAVIGDLLPEVATETSVRKRFAEWLAVLES